MVHAGATDGGIRAAVGGGPIPGPSRKTYLPRPLSMGESERAQQL